MQTTDDFELNRQRGEVMQYSTEQVMLTLAGLAYRCFQDVFSSSLHQDLVRDALLDGLDKFEPVRGQWELVWGPATTRHVPLEAFRFVAIFDWNVLYVVRHRTSRNKYVIAIRGTNPIEVQDWLFGDLWVGTAVAWPYGSGKELISTSTALGLASLQTMCSGPPAAVNNYTNVIAREALAAINAIARKAERILKALPRREGDERMRIEEQVSRILEHWVEDIVEYRTVRTKLQQLARQIVINPQELRPKLVPDSIVAGGRLNLLTFLRTQTDQASEPLEIIVTGHSKGGALAPTVALWLKEALSDKTECWDRKQTSRVSCCAFAGPTPGNADFAARVDAVLGEDLYQLINSNDIVPHAFQVDDLEQIPMLYGNRTAMLQPLVTDLVNAVKPLGYRHPEKGLHKFDGKLDSSRSLPGELVHQHLDAYLDELGLLSDEMNTFTLFF